MKKFFRIIITITAVGMAVWFLLPAFLYSIINAGNIIGVTICAFLIFRFGTVSLYNRLRSAFYRTGVTRIIFKLLRLCAAICAIYAVALSGVMVFFSMQAPAAESKATAVVLGAQVRESGPSVPLWQRIDAAVDYLNEHKSSAAVVTGGQGTNEPISEAKSMYDNITAKGINANRVYMEDKATNTRENIRYSMKIIENNKLNKNIAVVTDSYHQLRARIIAGKEGVKSDVYAVSTKSTKIGLILYPTMFVREWAAIPFEFLR